MSLGSNLAGRKDHPRSTLHTLSRVPNRVGRHLQGYETWAVEVVEEPPDYLHCVAEFGCDLPVPEFLWLCQEIERR